MKIEQDNETYSLHFIKDGSTTWLALAKNNTQLENVTLTADQLKQLILEAKAAYLAMLDA